MKDKGGLFPQPGGVAPGDAVQRELLPVEDQRPPVGRLQKIDAPQKGGLAGAAGPQNGHHVPLLHLEVYSLQHF